MLSIPKLLVIALVLGALYYLFFRKPKEPTTEAPKSKRKKKSNEKIEEVMVECAKCGTFLSAKEAIIKDGKYFCSKECAA